MPSATSMIVTSAISRNAAPSPARLSELIGRPAGRRPGRRGFTATAISMPSDSPLAVPTFGRISPKAARIEPLARQDLELYGGDAGTFAGNGVERGRGQVEAAPGYERATVVDTYDHRFAVLHVGHPDVGVEGQGP